MNTYSIINKLNEYFKERGYVKEKTSGLINKTFPNTFNPSAGHGIVRNILTSNALEKDRKFYILEKSFRFVDLNKIGLTNRHSLLFNMFAFAYSSKNTLENEIKQKKEVTSLTYNLLIKEFKLNPKKIIVSVFGGGKVRNKKLGFDKGFFNAWLEQGFSEDKIIVFNNEMNFVYVPIENDGAGPRSEIFYEYTKNKYIEIASLVTEKYTYQNGNIHLSKNVISGCAFGIERLNMVINNKKTIYNIDSFYPLKELTILFFTDKRQVFILNEEINQFIDLVKSIIFIIAENKEINKKQKEILKRLLSKINKLYNLLNINDIGIFYELTDKTAEIYYKLYPEIYENKERIYSFFHKHIKLFKEINAFDLIG